MAIFENGYNTWSDFDIELRIQTDGDIQKDLDVEAIRNSIQNICQTLMGSRRMLPPFATNLQYLLFEPITEQTAFHIANTLIASINKWDDRITLNAMEVIPDPDNSKYDCAMKLTIKNSQKEEEIDFVLRQQ